MSKRNLTESVKKIVAGKQLFKCANYPDKNIINFDCPLYKNIERNGLFGEEGYEVDHIIELSNGGTNDVENLQALCLSCHRVKTKLFLQTKKTNKKVAKKTKKMDINEFIIKFNLKEKVQKFLGCNSAYFPMFVNIKNDTEYNINEEPIFLKRDEYLELDLIEFFLGHRIKNPLNYDVTKIFNCGHISKTDSRVNSKYYMEYNRFNEFLENLNMLFPDKVDFKVSQVKF